MCKKESALLLKHRRIWWWSDLVLGLFLVVEIVIPNWRLFDLDAMRHDYMYIAIMIWLIQINT